MPASTDPQGLEGYRCEPFTALGHERPVWRTGIGPAVIVVHEIPGITPLVAAFGRKVADAGMTAVLPELFGSAGRPSSGTYVARSLVQACISREFSVLASDKTSPVVSWLRELASVEHRRCGGPGVGAVGMCLTGGIALGMMVDPVVVAPVLSQPSTPFPIGRARRRSVGLSPEDLAMVKERVAGGACLIGMRFTGDPAVPAERFEALRAALGEGFVGVEIDSSEKNPWGYRAHAHSVLTEDYIDDEGSPTRHALDQVLAFFASRLKPV
jgi:dienelactone hydrolase